MLPAYLDTFNHYLAIGTILLQLAIIVIIASLLFFRKNNPILSFFKDYTFYLGFLTALGGVAISLFYSQIIGFPPCELCWIERIFIYPQFILFGLDLFKRDHAIVDYSLTLAILGSIVSMYHVYIEHGGSSALACATGKAAVSCATLYVSEFGYITIPMMALTVQIFIIALILNYKYMTNNKAAQNNA